MNYQNYNISMESYFLPNKPPMNPPCSGLRKLLCCMFLLIYPIAIAFGGNYIITFDPGEGSLLSGSEVQSVPNGGTAIAPVLSAPEGMIFTGWDKRYSNVNEDILVTAQYVDLNLASVLENRVSIVDVIGDNNPDRRFGYSVSVSGDTAVIGDHRGYPVNVQDPIENRERMRGRAYVFVREGTEWVFQSELRPKDGVIPDYYGFSVAVSGDTAIVGNRGLATSNTGSAYIFVRNGEVWTQQGETLTAPAEDESEELHFFGRSVALEGDTALVGDPAHYSGTREYGYAYVYVRNNDEWTLQQRLDSGVGNNEFDGFGESVALSGDTIVIGAEDKDIGDYASDPENSYLDTGNVHIFERKGDHWYRQDPLFPGDPRNSKNFGNSVSVSGDTLLIGAYGDDPHEKYKSEGSVYFYKRGDQKWEFQQKIILERDEAHNFGNRVSLSGNTALVSAYTDFGEYLGLVYVLERDSSNNWNRVKTFPMENALIKGFGFSVSIDGDVAVIGASDDASDEGTYGSAYIFDLGVPPATVIFNPTEAGRLTSGELIQLVKLGDSAVAPEIDAQPGWAFSGWDQDFSNVEADLVVTAVFDRIYYTVDFNPGDNGMLISGDATQTIQPGNPAQAPTIQADSEWIFVGWDIDFSAVMNDLSVNALYEPARYKVVFDLGEGILLSGSEVQIVPNGGTAIAPALSAPEGRVFTGWDKSYHAIKSDLEIKAQYAYADITEVLEKKFTADNGLEFDIYGFSVAISGDTAIVGAPREDNSKGHNSGRAYIYIRENGKWSFQKKLMPVKIESENINEDDFKNYGFGWSVDIHGSTAIVGAPYGRNKDNVKSGAVYIYVRNSGVWSFQAKLTPDDGKELGAFGSSVAIDDEIVVVGSDNMSEPGSAYVFVQDSAGWTQLEKFKLQDSTSNDGFGYSVDVDKETVVVGAYKVEVNSTTAAGSAYVFTKNGSEWDRQELLDPNGKEKDEFGKSVAISGDTVIVGSPGDNDVYAHIFTRNGAGDWELNEPLVGEGLDKYDQFGKSVAISGDIAIVGADRFGKKSDGTFHTFAGCAYVFVRDNNAWDPAQILTASDGDGSDFFGFNVAISGDTVIAGAYGDENEGAGINAGSAYMTDLAAPIPDDKDSDGDGMPDIGEIIAGSDPFDSKNRFAIEALSFDHSSDSIILKFSARNDPSIRQFQIYYSNDLRSWMPVSDSTFSTASDKATEAVIDLPVDVDLDSLFFKVECFRGNDGFQ